MQCRAKVTLTIGELSLVYTIGPAEDAAEAWQKVLKLAADQWLREERLLAEVDREPRCGRKED